MEFNCFFVQCCIHYEGVYKSVVCVMNVTTECVILDNTLNATRMFYITSADVYGMHEVPREK